MRSAVVAVIMCCLAGPARADLDAQTVRPLVRAGLVVEQLVPDLSFEFEVDGSASGITLGWPILLRLTPHDKDSMVENAHWFALAVAEPQLAFGRNVGKRWRGVGAVRGGYASIEHRTSVFLEAGWHLSERSAESGAVFGVGVGRFPHSLFNIGLLVRYFQGDEKRVGLALDVSAPLQSYNLF